MGSIIPLPDAVRTGTAPDVRALAHALTRMSPSLWSPCLPGESWDDLLARREAARDILDDLLAEFAGTELEGEVAA